MLCQSLFLGGFETTVAQLGSTLYVLLSRRALWQELLDDPDLMPAAWRSCGGGSPAPGTACPCRDGRTRTSSSAVAS